MRFIGIDGFKKGWVAVAIERNTPTIAFYSDIGAALSKPFDLAFIDIPIGMNDDKGERCCDNLARGQLGPNASRVFTGVQRSLFADSNYAAANARLYNAGQPGISKQLWHLIPKIREVDEFVRMAQLPNIRECHPELVFLRLNKGTPLPSKKSAGGVLLRQKLLTETFPICIDWIGNDPLARYAALDDVLDACACALAARDAQPSRSLPSETFKRDAFGLAMQIWY